MNQLHKREEINQQLRLRVEKGLHRHAEQATRRRNQLALAAQEGNPARLMLAATRTQANHTITGSDKSARQDG